MPELPKIIEDLREVSDRISLQIRSLALGLIAFCWLLLFGKETIIDRAGKFENGGLFIVGILALLALFCDYLQYFFGYLCSKKVMEKAQKASDHKATYNYHSFQYRMRVAFFWLKQVVLVVDVVFLLILVIPMIIRIIWT